MQVVQLQKHLKQRGGINVQIRLCGTFSINRKKDGQMWGIAFEMRNRSIGASMVSHYRVCPFRWNTSFMNRQCLKRRYDQTQRDLNSPEQAVSRRAQRLIFRMEFSAVELYLLLTAPTSLPFSLKSTWCLWKTSHLYTGQCTLDRNEWVELSFKVFNGDMRKNCSQHYDQTSKYMTVA